VDKIYQRLWIKAMNSCFNHEGKIIPHFWRKNNGYGIKRKIECISEIKNESINVDKIKGKREKIS